MSERSIRVLVVESQSGPGGCLRSFVQAVASCPCTALQPAQLQAASACTPHVLINLATELNHSCVRGRNASYDLRSLLGMPQPRAHRQPVPQSIGQPSGAKLAVPSEGLRAITCRQTATRAVVAHRVPIAMQAVRIG